MIEVLKQALEVLELCTSAGMTPMHLKANQTTITSLRQSIKELESQEPIGYLCENAVGHRYFRWKKPPGTYKPIALYTHPPQRIWVDLTQQELDELDEQSPSLHDFVQNLMSKLKEKNT